MKAERPPSAFLDDRVVPYESVTVPIMAPCVKYAQLVFEGIRAYWSEQDGELYLFRVEDHSRRLIQSAALMRYNQTFSEASLTVANVTLLRALDYREDLHIRQMMFIGGDGALGAREPVHMAAVALPRGRKVGGGEGLHISISSWLRIDDATVPPRIKAAANYHNGRLGLIQAQEDGYDSTIFLNRSGRITEGPGACVFMVRDGVVVTPPVTAGLLDSITRKTLMEVSGRRLGRSVVEREVDRTELYIADEVFFCGTGAEITPILSIDRRPVGGGQVGEYTRTLREIYLRIVKGSDGDYRHWLTPVYQA